MPEAFIFAFLIPSKINMKNFILVIAFLLTYAWSYSSSLQPDSTINKPKRNPILSFNFQSGAVLPTNDFINNSDKKPTFTSASLKFGYGSTGDRWQDYAYGMPYVGIGLYFAQFFDERSLGKPFALYAYQGATLTKISKKINLNYEWNLGASFNWRPYDPFDNPENIALGSSTNVYVGLNLYFRWRLVNSWDLDFGVGVSHFSNGASHLPNKGLNLLSGLVSLNYSFYKATTSAHATSTLKPPVIEPRIDYDLLINISSRQRRFDTTRTNLPSEYLDKNFGVYGITFAPMLVKNYKYKYGVGVDLLYDESINAKAWREVNPADGKLYNRIKLAPFNERIALGFSIRGELTFPSYAIFANMGYNVIHKSLKDKRLYQVMGIKVNLKENFFGTFGIRANNFSKAQYLYWSLGYTFKGEPIYKIRKNIEKTFL